MGLVDSRKLFLKLCSLKWLIPSRSRVARLTPWGLWQVEIEMGAGLMKWRMVFLNIDKFLDIDKCLDPVCSIQR